MRIIAGRFKGRRLLPVPGDTVRSTADRVKESLFNILAAELPGASVLDLFCGAGTLGLEALSRGAERAIFVDQSRRSLNRTADNAAALGLTPTVRLVCADALASLKTSSRQHDRFNVIFSDPPYGDGWPSRVLSAVALSACRAPEGILVIEHHKKDPPGPDPTGFSLWTSRRFGDTVITLWRWSEEKVASEPSLP